jgi:hypothetical protein
MGIDQILPASSSTRWQNHQKKLREPLVGSIEPNAGSSSSFSINVRLSRPIQK